MVLAQQRPSAYNEMLGRMSDPHQERSIVVSTSEDRPAKRHKTSENWPSKYLGVVPSKKERSSSEASLYPYRQRAGEEIPDSDAESGSEVVDAYTADPSPQRTDLEQALAPVKTDRDAINEYEASRSASDALSSEEQRLGQRDWVKGKSSIYVDAFNLALETVLKEEAHLFDDSERAVFDAWKSLCYDTQYLYVRLFLRKTAAWHRIDKLRYYGDIRNMHGAISELFTERHLTKHAETSQLNVNKSWVPGETELRDSFTFADNSNVHITSVEEASSLLALDELKALGKEAKFHGKNKSELLNALRRTSGTQTSLAFNTDRNEPDPEKIDLSALLDNTSGKASKLGHSANSRDSHFLRRIMSEVGQCVRLSAAAHKLFERVHLVFYRSTEWTEKSLTTIILARIARRNFPDYIVSRSSNIFPSRAHLLEFEASLRTQFRVDDILEFNGTPSHGSLQIVIDILEDIYPRWEALLAEEQKKEDSIYKTGEGAYLRRLSPAWVYTRIVHKGACVLGLGKFKDYAREHSILSKLLSQRLFHSSRRGAWYQRKALLEEHYMGAIAPTEGRSQNDQKRYWKRIALKTCEQGLQDNLVHVIYHYDLQKRVLKLERALKIPKRLQHEFGHSRLALPIERTFEGVRIEYRLPAKLRTVGATSLPGEQSSSKSGHSVSITRRGTKTIWLDPSPDSLQDREVSVEAMCLSHYRILGWKGFHSEGGILRTLFSLLFYDILFTYVPNVFQTPYQTCPLDLHTDAFFPSRMSEINARLADMANGLGETILVEVWEREFEKKTCVVGLDWGFDLDDLRSIVRSFGGEKLATVCKIMSQEYVQRGGGVPDLFLWREEDCMQVGEVMFAEVKSENDRLSDTQRLWIHVLTGVGIRVELCNAVAKEVRVI